MKRVEIFKFTRHPSPSRNLVISSRGDETLPRFLFLKFVILEKGKTRRFRQGLKSGNGGFPRKGHRKGVEPEEGPETL